MQIYSQLATLQLHSRYTHPCLTPPSGETPWGKLFVRPLSFPMTKLRTKFEVSSSDENMFDRMPKVLRVTWLLRKIICAPARLSKVKAMYQIWSL